MVAVVGVGFEVASPRQSNRLHKLPSYMADEPWGPFLSPLPPFPFSQLSSRTYTSRCASGGQYSSSCFLLSFSGAHKSRAIHRCPRQTWSARCFSPPRRLLLLLLFPAKKRGWCESVSVRVCVCVRTRRSSGRLISHASACAQERLPAGPLTV